MISTIYVPTLTIINIHENEIPFSDCVLDLYPNAAELKFPENVTLKSINHVKDHFMDAFIEHVFKKYWKNVADLTERGADIEIGYYELEIDSNESTTHKKLEYIEYIFQKLHEHYKFISSIQFYLGDNRIHKFCRMYTSETDEDEDETEVDDKYYDVLNSYFYSDGDIPSGFLDEIAKIYLLQEGI